MEQALGAKTSETLTGEFYTEVNTNHVEAQN
jgi:hypothetical protein